MTKVTNPAAIAQIALVEAAQDAIKGHTDSLKAKFQNENLDLEERWAIFSACVDLGILPTKPYLFDIENIRKDWCLYDTFYMERHETKTYTRLLEMMEEEVEEPATDEEIEKFKRLVLSEGYGGFENDW